MSNLITLQIEGTPSEGGHILVSDFIERLENLLSTLNGIDRIVGNTSHATLNYRIVDAKHTSPLTFTLEPVIKARVKKPEPHHIENRHKRFFSEMAAIRDRKPISPEIDDSLLIHFQRLVEGVGKDFTKARIFNGKVSVDLDSEFETSVRKLLDEEDASYGCEEGMLEAVNIHGRNRTCWIYPRIGPQRIRCDFMAGTRDQIRENLGKYVRVEGIKYFRPNSPFAFRVSVRDFDALPGDVEPFHIKDIYGIAPDATKTTGTMDFITDLRDEWD